MVRCQPAETGCVIGGRRAVSVLWWTYQAITWQGQTYLLTRLGFGLSVAPKVMTAIVTHVLGRDPVIQKGTSAYVDDIYVDECVVQAQVVVEHLRRCGLEAKDPVRLGDKGGTRVLGVRVDEALRWTWDKQLPAAMSGCLTRRQVHALVGEWLGHFPVCGWLRVSCAYFQRCTAQEAIGWDDHVSSNVMDKVADVQRPLREEGDPACGTVDGGPRWSGAAMDRREQHGIGGRAGSERRCSGGYCVAAQQDGHLAHQPGGA